MARRRASALLKQGEKVPQGMEGDGLENFEDDRTEKKHARNKTHGQTHCAPHSAPTQDLRGENTSITGFPRGRTAATL